MNIQPQLQKEANSILAKEAIKAAQATGEYDQPIFYGPLEKAALMPESVIMSVIGEDKLSVVIDLDSTAGELVEFAQAVAKAKEQVSSGEASTARASVFWREFVYKPTREGGGAGKDTSLYYETWDARRANFSSLAPYWKLIDKGNVGKLGDGVPYPLVSPTNFVSKARAKIRRMALNRYRKEVVRVSAQLDEDSYGAGNALDSILDILDESAAGAGWQPGTILRKLELGQRKYKIYITRTGKIGFSLV